MCMRSAQTADVWLETELVDRFGLSGRAAHQLMKRCGTRVGRIRLLSHEKLLAYLRENAGDAADSAEAAVVRGAPKEDHRGS